MPTPDENLKLTADDLKVMNGPWRVWEIALQRMNNWGHAGFRPGELAQIACGKDSVIIVRWYVAGC